MLFNLNRKPFRPKVCIVEQNFCKTKFFESNKHKVSGKFLKMKLVMKIKYVRKNKNNIKKK